MSPAAELGPNLATLTRREGFRLISTRRVAIPVWRADIKCRVLRTRQILATDEFVLRAIGLGISSADEVAQFLNLPQELVDGVVSTFLADRHIVTDWRGDKAGLILSKRGAELAANLVEQKPIEKTVQFHVDGLAGEPVSISRSSLLTSAQLDDWPHLVLEPENEVDLDFGPADTDRFMAVMTRGRTRGEDVLLSVIETEGTMKRYRPAAGLLFQSTSDPDDMYLRICVDGRAQDDVEGSLRERGVMSSLGLATRISEDRNRVDRALSAELAALRTDDRITESLREEIVQLGSPVTAEVAGSASHEPTSSSNTRAANRLAGLQIRRLECVEAPEALQLSLSAGRAEILISTSRFWHQDQDDHYLDLLRQLLVSGVKINLEIPSDSRQMSRPDRECLARLKDELEGDQLVLWESKASHEANFVSIDGEIAYVFAGSPFTDLATSAERFGDDRPTVVVGMEHVQRFLSVVHGDGPAT